MPKGVYPRISIKERLLSKVNTTDPKKCWEWTASKSKGYGRTSILNNHCVYAHRLSYEIHNNIKLGSNVEICHKCDNKACINPSHIYAGNRNTNAKDAADRNRMPFGTKVYCAKLNDEKVKFIRRVLKSKSISGTELARKFKVSHGVIYCAKNRVTWRRVT